MGAYIYAGMDPVKKKAALEINGRLAEIAVLYAEAAEIAVEAGIDFRYDGPADYGDGGYFHLDEDNPENGGYWQASSNSC